MRAKSKTHAGFTLIEMIVAVGVVAMVSTLLLQIFVTATRTNTKTEVLKEVKQNGDFAVEIISRILRNAREVTSTCTAAGTASTSLTVTNPDGGSTTLGCVLDGTSTRVASVSAGRTDYLTSANVTLGGADCATSNLQFVCISAAGAPPTIGVSFTLSQKGTPVSQLERASGWFQTSVTLRSIESL